MISATQFANGNSSIWREIAPSSERVIRKLNLTVDRFYVGDFDSMVSPQRFGLVNEVAFELTKLRLKSEWLPQIGAPKEATETAFDLARARLGRLNGVRESDLAILTPIEVHEANVLCTRLYRFIEWNVDSDVEFSPRFAGCGTLYPSEGDFRSHETLYEIKAGARPYRSSDLRQLLVYCAANYADKHETIQKIGLVNPRLGTCFVWNTEAICFELGGMSPQEMFEQIVYHLSSGGISR